MFTAQMLFDSHPDRVRPKIVCVDGTTLSVQASSTHYCSPRDDEGPYYEVEVGYPSIRPEPWDQWREYCEDSDNPTDTVYGWVPIELVHALIALHGGIAPTP